MSEDEQGKQMLIIVKRGMSVDYEEKKHSPFKDGDIRRDFPGKAWEHIRERYANSG